MIKFFVNMSCNAPSEMFRALDISRIVNLLFAQIISLIFEMFSSLVKVDRGPERCSSSVDSASP
jgi:hypothetical protein